MRAAEAFDRLVTASDPSMVIVTAAAGDDRDGCLVGFHGQCSIEPRRYAVWLSVVNHTFRIAERTSVLGVHLVGSHQHELAALFGGESVDDGTDKLRSVAWTAGPDGVPLLDDLQHRFAGRVIARIALDCDHALYELEPIDAGGSPPELFDPLRLQHVTDISPGHPLP